MSQFFRNFPQFPAIFPHFFAIGFNPPPPPPNRNPPPPWLKGCVAGVPGRCAEGLDGDPGPAVPWPELLYGELETALQPFL